MTNQCKQKIAFKGSQEQVLNFINDGLKAVFTTPESEIYKAFHTLFVGCKNYVNMGLWIPLPETFNKDTTNYPNKFPDEVKYQKETYGIVGWRDYNIYKRFGTKWGTELTDAELLEKDGIFTLTVSNETVDNYPNIWMENMSSKYGFNIYFVTYKEGSQNEIYGTIKNNMKTLEGEKYTEEYEGEMGDEEYQKFLEECQLKEKLLNELKKMKHGTK